MLKGSPSTDWFERFRDGYAIHNLTALRTELSYFLIRWDDANQLHWMELGDPRANLKPFHFEIFFDKAQPRDLHYAAALDRSSQENSVVVTELYGFWDLFCPLPSRGKPRDFIFAGQFLRKAPDWESISQQWHNVSGRQPASADPDFVQFVRMTLRLPVIEDGLLDALKSFVQLYSEHLADTRKPGEFHGQIDELNREQFARLWPIDDWTAGVLSPNKFQIAPWHHEGQLTEWMKEGMGLTRLPTTAMALMPLDSRQDALDPVQTLVRNAEIQRACTAFVNTLPNTAATPLQDYGLSIITSTKHPNNRTQLRLELRERAQKFRTFVHKRFGIRAVVGIGPSLAPGALLNPSHREAVLALHMCAQLDKNILFFDEHGSADKFRYSELYQASGVLSEALDRENSTELKLASDRYIRLVLRYSGERIEVARSQLLATLFQLFGAVQRRNPMRADARERFADELTRKLESAHSLYQVIENFNGALQRLSFVASKAWQGPNVMRLEATLQYLRSNFVEPLPLPDVARKAGFSVPAFSRVFKKATGTTFLAYLRAIRVDHAKKLLATTPMTTEQIAQACGFQSQHHLIRSFKKVASQTPGAYRRSRAGKTKE